MLLSNSIRNIWVKLLAVSVSVLPILVFGQGPPGGRGPQTLGGLFDLLKLILNWVAAVFFVVAVIFIILAAFSYLTAGGDDEKVKSAKNKLVYAVVAIIVAALAFVIPNIVQTFLGTDIGNEPPSNL